MPRSTGPTCGRPCGDRGRELPIDCAGSRFRKESGSRALYLELRTVVLPRIRTERHREAGGGTAVDKHLRRDRRCGQRQGRRRVVSDLGLCLDLHCTFTGRSCLDRNAADAGVVTVFALVLAGLFSGRQSARCLLYTSDAADE